MTWVILWVEHADIVGDYPEMAQACRALAVFLEEHPWCAGQIAVREINDKGMAVGEPIYNP